MSRDAQALAERQGAPLLRPASSLPAELASPASARPGRVLAFTQSPDQRRRQARREATMKRLISALWLVSNLAIGTAWAQPYAPNDMGVTMGHWHLNSADVEANKSSSAWVARTSRPACSTSCGSPV